MAFSCRTARNLTTGCLAAAWLLCAAPAPLSAVGLNPVSSNIGVSSLTFSWPGGAPGSYTTVLSTASNFSVLTATGTSGFLITTMTYLNLTQNEVYYFKVKRSTDLNTAYETQAGAPTVTWASSPTALGFVPIDFMSDSSSTARVGLKWQVNGNPDWTDYRLEYYKVEGTPWGSTFNEQRPPMSLSPLEANTSYYFRVSAVSVDSVQSAPSNIVSTATLAVALSSVTAAVYETSTTVSWQELDSSTQAQRAEGYMLTLSLSDTFAHPLPGWSTATNTLSSKTLTGLDPNTTYYYEVGSLNINGAMNSDGIRNFTTLAVQPQGLHLISADTQTASLDWTALPAGPSSATALGYRLEASSSNFNGGTVLTTATYNIAESTLTVSDLDPNTTYYFRVGTLNPAGAPNYSTKLSTITLTAPLTQVLTSANATQTGITVNLNPPFPSSPPYPQKSSCEGYLLLGSSTAFAAGSVVHSSASYSNLTNSLTFDTLRPNTIYSLRMATLNWIMTPNFIDLPPIQTSMAGALVSVNITDIWESSATIYWTDGLETDGYVLEASTQSWFGYIRSSSTIDSGAATLTVTGLDRNTAYFFKAGALYNGATQYTPLTTNARSTLAEPLTLAADFTGVFHSSVTVSWTPLGAGAQNTTAEGYHLEASTSPDFTNVVYTAATPDPMTASLTVQDLLPNTSYYFRAGTLNWDDVENYSYTPATSTLANKPLQTAFTLQTTDQMTLNWESDLPNPPDTLYRVRFSSNSDMLTPVVSSDTRNTFASFGSLEPNTTYYSEVTAVNRLNMPEGPYPFTAMATLAYVPDFADFSGIGVSSLTLNWLRGENPSTNDTDYRAEISLSPDFSPLLSSVTLNTSATFYELVSDATYYLRVYALNRTGVTTSTRTLGAALTLPATAYILPLADTFSGLMTDGFTMHWAANGNSANTVYNLVVSTANDFNPWASSQTVSVTGLTYTFGDLMVDTTYWAKIQSRGQNETLTVFVATGPVTTLLSEDAGALVSNDTTVTLQTSYGLISVFIPFGALGGSSRITISTIRPQDSFMPPYSAVSVLRPTGIGIIINQFPPVLVLNPITIVLPYRPSDLSLTVDRSKLVLALYDESSHVWVPLPTVSDLANNKVTAQTWHLSTFQLMESLPAAELGGVKVYPNPYTPSSISNVMHFSNMPPYARVKIYTFLGELVKALTADENGMTYWDGRNTDGKKAASGVYIALLQTQDKKSHKMVKVVLER